MVFLEYSELRSFITKERKHPSKHGYTFLPSNPLRSTNQILHNSSVMSLERSILLGEQDHTLKYNFYFPLFCMTNGRNGKFMY